MTLSHNALPPSAMQCTATALPQHFRCHPPVQLTIQLTAWCAQVVLLVVCLAKQDTDPEWMKKQKQAQGKAQ